MSLDMQSHGHKRPAWRMAQKLKTLPEVSRGRNGYTQMEYTFWDQTQWVYLFMYFHLWIASKEVGLENQMMGVLYLLTCQHLPCSLAFNQIKIVIVSFNSSGASLLCFLVSTWNYHSNSLFRWIRVDAVLFTNCKELPDLNLDLSFS